MKQIILTLIFVLFSLIAAGVLYVDYQSAEVGNPVLSSTQIEDSIVSTKKTSSIITCPVDCLFVTLSEKKDSLN